MEAASVSVSSGSTAPAPRIEPPVVELAPPRDAECAVWGNRYMEAQEAQPVCGRHAINNLLGAPRFTDEQFRTAAQMVVADTKEPAEHHIKDGGWYSHSVLALVMDLVVPPTCRMLAGPQRATSWRDLVDDDSVLGTLVNLDNMHWFCIVFHNGGVWKVDSMMPVCRLTEESHTKLLRRHPTAYAAIRNDGTRVGARRQLSCAS